MKNILSIDLESWIHIYEEAVREKPCGPTSQDRNHEDNDYVRHATADILDTLDRYGHSATFFIVGEVYEWYPEIIDEIEVRGHEIGYHTHNHTVLRSAELLEQEFGQSSGFIQRFRPIGFRAPQIYITRDLVACLKNYGFRYSSSTYDVGGIRKIDGIDEIPVSTISFWGKRDDSMDFPMNLTLKSLFRQLPFGSGLFIALLGSKVSFLIDYLNRKDMPAVLFVHPWQIYPAGRISGLRFKLKVLLRSPLWIPYSRNIKGSFEKVLQKYEFISFKEYYYS